MNLMVSARGELFLVDVATGDGHWNRVECLYPGGGQQAHWGRKTF